MIGRNLRERQAKAYGQIQFELKLTGGTRSFASL